MLPFGTKPIAEHKFNGNGSIKLEKIMLFHRRLKRRFIITLDHQSELLLDIETSATRITLNSIKHLSKSFVQFIVT